MHACYREGGFGRTDPDPWTADPSLDAAYQSKIYRKDGPSGSDPYQYWTSNTMAYLQRSGYWEGERNIQGFFTAYLSVNAYYLTAPEVELNHGYCDLFLMPDLLHYEVNHSYIIELKYLSEKDSDAKAEIQWEEAVEQIKGYAAAPKVRQLIQNTKLHCIVMQFRGWELQRMEEQPVYCPPQTLPLKIWGGGQLAEVYLYSDLQLQYW